jgi:uncharacterized protein involved in exopolysaccharide biosynthesis
MFQKARETAYLESTSLLFLLMRWRKPLAIILLLTLVASFIFSGPTFIKPKYRSSVVFFPSATNSVSKALLEESNSEKQDILAFGEEEQAEQMLQILNSDEIRETIVNKYDLLTHYQINKADAFPMTKLYEEFKDNINFSRTEFMSVRIDVLDTDPEMAANIANDIASLLDSMKSKIQRSRAESAFAIVKSAYLSKMELMKVKEDSLRKICEEGVMDFATQTELLSKEYITATSIYTNEVASLSILDKFKSETDTNIVGTKARIKGAEARIKSLKVQLNKLAQFGGASVSLNEELTLDREDLSKMKKQYDKAYVDVQQNLTPKFIVNKAVKAEKKSYPVRWLIVVVSITITFLLSIVVLLIVERVKEIKYNL